jgi:hypothetical protein
MLVQALLVPAIAINIAHDFGPRSVDKSIGISCVIGGVSGILVDTYLNLPFSPVLWTLAGLLVNGASASALLWLMLQRIEKLDEMAPHVPLYGLSMFDKIDTQNTGIIRADMIWSALKAGLIHENVRDVWEHIANEVATIGHVVDVFPGEMYSPMPVCIYGISREDFRSYGARITPIKKGWFYE